MPSALPLRLRPWVIGSSVKAGSWCDPGIAQAPWGGPDYNSYFRMPVIRLKAPTVHPPEQKVICRSPLTDGGFFCTEPLGRVHRCAFFLCRGINTLPNAVGSKPRPTAQFTMLVDLYTDSERMGLRGDAHGHFSVSA